MKKPSVKLIANFQPRMSLGPKRYNEEGAGKGLDFARKSKTNQTLISKKQNNRWTEVNPLVKKGKHS